MLDPRIYRTGMIAVALAVVVFAFSLYSEPNGAASNLAPDAFSGRSAYVTMLSLARQYPDRSPGSAGDVDVAELVAGRLSRSGFAVQKITSTGATPSGPRALESVVATRPGQSAGSIVVVAPRDSTSASASPAALSGTAVLLELARVLSGETQRHTVVLASISGSAGQAGALRLARSLPGPVEAVLALGDLAGSRAREPLVLPWSDGAALAPVMLRRTVTDAVRAQAGLRSGGTSIAAQLAHLALPLTPGAEGAFNSASEPSVLLSLSGERDLAGAGPVSDPVRIGGMGKAVLQSLTALDRSHGVPAPAAYLVYSGKVVPAWAVRLLALTLILPILMVTVDAGARAARRGDPPWRALGWTVAAALPFAAALALLVMGRVAGLLHAPQGVLALGTAPLGSGGVALVIALAGLVALGLFGWQRLRALRSPATEAGAGAPSAILLVLCVVSLAVWVDNPFAALLVVPALHLWPWALDCDLALPRPVAVVLLLAGLLAPALVVVYEASALGLGPSQALWHGVLLIAGGGIAPLVLAEWALLLGCLTSGLAVAWARRQGAIAEQPEVTVRGPITYAGPGSLGGTESALRR